MPDAAVCLSVCTAFTPGRPPPCCPESRRWNWPELSALRTFVLMLSAPAIVFFLTVCSELAVRLSPAVMVGGIAIYACSSTLLLLTAFLDPGTIPSGESPLPKSMRGQYARREAVVGNRTFVLKPCVTCSIYRPPRSSHCRECNRCVEKWDHHCPWVGNCVGRGNYRCFFGFLVVTIAFCAYVSGFSICELVLRTQDVLASAHAPRARPHAAGDGGGAAPDRTAERAALRSSAEGDSLSAFGVAVGESPAAFVLALYTIIVGVLLCMLCTYHCYLICVNETTNENVKDLYYDGNPFDAGARANCAHVCCWRDGPEIELLDEGVEEAQLEAVAEPGATPFRFKAARLSREEPMRPADEGEDARLTPGGEIELSDVPARYAAAGDANGEGEGAAGAANKALRRGRRGTPRELAHAEHGAEDDGSFDAVVQPSTSQLSSEVDEQDLEQAASKPLLVPRHRGGGAADEAGGDGAGAGSAEGSSHRRARPSAAADDAGNGAHVNGDGDDGHDADADDDDSEHGDDVESAGGLRGSAGRARVAAASSRQAAAAVRRGERYCELAK